MLDVEVQRYCMFYLEYKNILYNIYLKSETLDCQHASTAVQVWNLLYKPNHLGNSVKFQLNCLQTVCNKRSWLLLQQDTEIIHANKDFSSLSLLASAPLKFIAVLLSSLMPLRNVSVNVSVTVSTKTPVCVPKPRKDLSPLATETGSLLCLMWFTQIGTSGWTPRQRRSSLPKCTLLYVWPHAYIRARLS